jgi:hypothetical protein
LLVLTPTIVGVLVFWVIQRASDSTKLLCFWLFAVSVLLLWGTTLPTALTRVLLTFDGDRLRIEWNFGRRPRGTEVNAADLLDVALEADPKSRTHPMRRVVIGMRGWDLPLAVAYSGNIEDQERARAELAAFLGVPEGTRDPG